MEEKSIGKIALLCAEALFKVCKEFVGQKKFEEWLRESHGTASDLGSSKEAKEKLEAERRKRAKMQQVLIHIFPT